MAIEKLKCDLSRPTCAMSSMRGKINELVDAMNETGGGGSSRAFAVNLLDNSDFRNPVNQRGKLTYYDAGYGIDRWILTASATMNVIPGRWIETNNYIRQRLPKGVLDSSKQYTVAWQTGDGVIHVNYGSVSFTSIENGSDFDEVYINIEGATIAIVWCAIYEGIYTPETLPAYMPKNELMECLRYYHVYGTAAARPSHGLDASPPMRINNPTQGSLSVDGETRYYNSAEL